jgi:TonB family protein
MSFASIFPSKKGAPHAPAIALVAVLTFVMLCLAQCRPAEAANCPRTLYLESTNDKYYVAVFTAPTAMKSSIDITFYSKANAYTTSLVQISIEKPWTRDSDKGFRSYTALFANPGDDPLLGAVVRPYGFKDDTICPPAEVLIPSTYEVKNPSQPPSPDKAALDGQIAAEAGDGTNAFSLTQTALPGTMPCANPFAEARTIAIAPIQFADPPSPLAAEVTVDMTPAGVVTNVTVSKSSGNAGFDQATIAAARKTTYAPQIFACIAQAGRYPYRASIKPGAAPIHKTGS